VIILTLDEILKEYEKKTIRSKKAFLASSEIIPGGISANVKYFKPYPIFMKAGRGAWLTDVDHNQYVDYVLSYGPLILGHGREEVVDSIQQHFNDHFSMLYGTPHEMESVFAHKIQKYYPSIEMLRYTNSGTEATLLCIRTAYAYTNKYKICKFEGHYHGGFNEVLVSVNPDVTKAGDIHHPTGVSESAGLPPDQLEDTIILPFNDLNACKEILTVRQNEIAAIIMEPILGGFIPATHEFMHGIRKLTKDLGIVMIMDEVKTGFRVALGGAQEYYSVKPDLTALGKIIGAGLPIGIVGGRADIMMKAAPRDSDILDPGNKGRTCASDILYHSGTYNGHPLILSAGYQTIEILEKEFTQVVDYTNQLKEGIHKAYASHGIKILTPGIGAMFNIAVTELDQIKNYRDMGKSDFELRRKIDYLLLLEGIYNKPCNRYNLSTAHTPDVIDFTLKAYQRALKKR
jgi:glutamate-1-semialdehyde 2,1-aminomutase